MARSAWPCRRRYALLGALTLVQPALAVSLQISPVMVHFAADQAASSIRLSNPAAVALYGQVRVFAWEQRGGEDVLTPTTELVASPPILNLAANSSQTVRLVLRSGARPGPERSYRLLIDEIGRNQSAGSGVAIQLQYSVPVFVATSLPQAAAALTWRLSRHDGSWLLHLKNSGSAHAQVAATTLVDRAGNAHVISQGLLGYALAGRERSWRLPLSATLDLADSVLIRTTINARAMQVTGSITPADAANK